MSLRIIDWLESLTTTTNKITSDITPKLGTSADVAEAPSIFGKLNKIIGLSGSAKVVKSIQYGVAHLGDSYTSTVAINPVDVNKTIVLLNGAGYWSGSDKAYSSPAYLAAKTSNSITISTVSYARGGDISYQVIEFY